MIRSFMAWFRLQMLYVFPAFISNIYGIYVHELKKYRNIIWTLKMLVIIIKVFLPYEQSSAHLERCSRPSDVSSLCLSESSSLVALLWHRSNLHSHTTKSLYKMEKCKPSLTILVLLHFALSFYFSVIHTTNNAQWHVLPAFCFSLSSQIPLDIFSLWIFVFVHYWDRKSVV